MNNQQKLKPFTITGLFDPESNDIISVELVKKFSELPKSPNLTKAEKINNPNLISKIKKGNILKVKKLLDKNCDPDIEDEDGKSCLRCAIYINRIDILKLLVEAGADINKISNFGNKFSPLDYASYLGLENIAKYLLEKGADINSCDKDGDTPLHNAIRSNNPVEIIELLLKHEPDYTKKNNKGETALDMAKLFNSTTAVKLIEDHIKSKEERPNSTANLPKELTSATNAPEILVVTTKTENAIVSPAEMPTAKVEKIKNPKLISKIKKGNILKVKKLLDENCDPDIEDESRRPCIRIAYDCGNFEILKLLVEAGADINKESPNSGYATVLNRACFNNNEKVIKYLVEKGADVNGIDDDGDNALHDLCRYGFNSEIFKLLVEKGVDYTKKNKFGRTPLEQVKHNDNNRDMIPLIEEYLKTKENPQNQPIVAVVSKSNPVVTVDPKLTTVAVKPSTNELKPLTAELKPTAIETKPMNSVKITIMVNDKPIVFEGPYDLAKKFVEDNAK